MVLRKAETDDFKPVKKLYKSSFPINERAPFMLLRKRFLQNTANLLIAEHKGEFTGFAYCIPYKNLVYLFYLAVSEEKRGKGAGSQMLGLLKEYYSGQQLFLAREPLDENAKNRTQRIRRHEFYLKNGFIDLPYQIQEVTMVYDIMGTDENFEPENYNILINRWLGSFLSTFLKMRIAE